MSEREAPLRFDAAALAEEARGRVRRFGERARRYLALRGGVAVLGALLAAGVATFLVDRLLRLGPWARLALALGALVVVGRIAWRFLARPLRGRWEELDLAAALDRRAPVGVSRSFVAQRLATLTQLAERMERPREDDSPEFISRALRTSHEELAAHPLEGALDHRRARRNALLCVALVVLPATLFVFSDDARLWARRWFLLSNEKWPQDTYLAIRGAEGGRMIVPRAEAIELVAYARDGSVVPKRVEIEYAIDGGAEVREVMSRYGENDFRIQLPGIRDRAEIWLRGGDDRLGPVVLEARDRPSVEGFDLEARLEQDGSVENFSFARQNENLAFRRDTRMRLDLRTNEPVGELEIAAPGGEGITRDRLDDRRERLTWTHVERRVLSIEFTSVATGLRSRPVSLDLGLREDSAPRLTFGVEGVRDRVTPVATVPTSILARDDFALRDVNLEVLVATPGAESGAPAVTLLAEFEKEAAETAFERERRVELSELGLKVGQTVELAASARDHCHLGPQTGRSRPRVLRVVSPEELFREIALRLQRTRARFRQAHDDAIETRDRLAREEDAMSRAEELLRRHRLLEREVWSAARQLESSVLELQLNRLVEREAEEILRRNVLEPLARLHDRDLLTQRTGLEGVVLGREDAPDRAVTLERQEGIVREMKRILEGLKQWDSFIDLINQLNEIIKVQDGVRDDTMGGGR
ncbi:MAG: hypothetical protein R3F20_15480 [Planctomycetota bacterium]